MHRLRAARQTRGHEQQGARLAVVVQSDLLPLSTWLVAPTSTAARSASFRPEIEVEGRMTRPTKAVGDQLFGRLPSGSMR
ncbi:MAG: type II toxin-antitoxin system PemK/MazF family toxin [Pseudonocardiaceae bacterium]